MSATTRSPGDPPATRGRLIAQRPARAPLARVVAIGMVLLALVGAAALGVAAVGIGPAWLDGAGSTAVVTAMAWALAARTGGRPAVTALLVVVLGVGVVLIDVDVLRTGAAVLSAAVAGVLGVVATVPAVRFLAAVREVVLAIAIGAAGAVVVLGFAPTVSITRFELVSLGLSFVLVLGLVARLGAGLHGLGRRGLLLVLSAAVVLFASLLYAELLERYGAASVVESIDDLVSWCRSTLGACPRPLVVLLGVPALVWGVHMRARRRQGWWVCAFGVAATTVAAQSLVDPRGGWLEAGLEVVYGLALGLVVGYGVVRLDLALTAPRGRRGRRAEESGAHRPEPRRLTQL